MIVLVDPPSKFEFVDPPSKLEVVDPPSKLDVVDPPSKFKFCEEEFPNKELLLLLLLLDPNSVLLGLLKSELLLLFPKSELLFLLLFPKSELLLLVEVLKSELVDCWLLLLLFVVVPKRDPDDCCWLLLLLFAFPNNKFVPVVADCWLLLLLPKSEGVDGWLFPKSEPDVDWLLLLLLAAEAFPKSDPVAEELLLLFPNPVLWFPNNEDAGLVVGWGVPKTEVEGKGGVISGFDAFWSGAVRKFEEVWFDDWPKSGGVGFEFPKHENKVSVSCFLRGR